VCTSRDSHPASRMINRAIICGLASVGVNIQDLRVMPTPISRYTIRSGVARGGIHTRISPYDSRSFLLEFYDKRGINIDKSAERKIENVFFREDFRRTSLEEVGDIGFPSRALEHYTEGFFHHLDLETIIKAGFKVVIDYAFNTSCLILPVLLGKFGCETVAINAYLDSKRELQSQDERDKSLSQLSKVVTTLKADLGILIADDAEKLILIDENGFIVPDNVFLAVLARLVLRSHPDMIIAAPVSAPSVLDRIAHELKGNIIRTKLDGRSLMHTASLGEKKIAFAGNDRGSFIFPAFQACFDGIFAFGKLLELLATHKTSASAAVAAIPPFYQKERSLMCSFQDKGRVMRKLNDANRDKPIETIDGIKIYFDGGWVLVVPDPTEPTIHIFAEASSQQAANDILDNYEEKLEALRQEDDSVQEPVPPVPAKKPASKREETPEYRRSLPQEKSFHFWVPGRYLGKRAQSLKEFVDTLHYVEIESVEYHMEREDFANWIEYELENEILASKIRTLKSKGRNGEDLRNEIIKLMQYRERM
jgi:mannose-1-phosphate guanylyltransferase / phosphomannomutase